MSLIKKSVLWNCVLQVQLYISLPDNIFEVFLPKKKSRTGSTNILHKQQITNDDITFLRNMLEKLCCREIRKK